MTTNGPTKSLQNPRRALFWLAKGRVTIQCGNSYEELRAGDYVIFDDSQVHCVVADNQWWGAAAQYL